MIFCVENSNKVIQQQIILCITETNVLMASNFRLGVL